VHKRIHCGCWGHSDSIYHDVVMKRRISDLYILKFIRRWFMVWITCDIVRLNWIMVRHIALYMVVAAQYLPERERQTVEEIRRDK